MVAAPIHAHSPGDAKFDSAPTAIVICRLGGDSFSVIVAPYDNHLFRMCYTWDGNFYVEGGNSGRTFLPTGYIECIAPHLRSKACNIPHEFLRPVAGKFIVAIHIDR